MWCPDAERERPRQNNGDFCFLKEFMRLSESLAGIGQAVAYYPKLAKFFGSVNAAIFFGQLHYWQQRTDNELGVYKTSEDWTEETGLSYREQATVRAALRSKGFLIETNKRLDHRIYFLLDSEAVDAAFSEWLEAEDAIQETCDPVIPERRKRNSGDAENAVREVRQTQFVNKDRLLHKTTTESVKRVTAPTRPEEVDEQIWSDWVQLRKQKKAAITETAINGIRREASKAGISLNEAMQCCCELGWQGFKADWYANQKGGNRTMPNKRIPAPENFDAKDYGEGIQLL